jgi:hypothetical protein
LDTLDGGFGGQIMTFIHGEVSVMKKFLILTALVAVSPLLAGCNDMNKKPAEVSPEDAAKSAEDTAAKLKEGFEETGRKLEEDAKAAAEEVKEAGKKAAEGVKEAAEDVKDAASDAVDKVKKAADDLKPEN